MLTLVSQYQLRQLTEFAQLPRTASLPCLPKDWRALRRPLNFTVSFLTKNAGFGGRFLRVTCLNHLANWATNRTGKLLSEKEKKLFFLLNEPAAIRYGKDMVEYNATCQPPAARWDRYIFQPTVRAFLRRGKLKHYILFCLLNELFLKHWSYSGETPRAYSLLSSLCGTNVSVTCCVRVNLRSTITLIYG